MKESSGKTKKLSKGVRRARSMRNVVMMVLVCVLMLSAATYAWFTLSNTAKVANMTMTVGEVTGLQIAPDFEADNDDPSAGDHGTYGSELIFDGSKNYSKLGDSTKNVTYSLSGSLLPATMVQTAQMRKPIYAEDGSGKVIDLESFASDGSNIMRNGQTGTYYAYKTHFYLKALGEGDYTITLADRSVESLTTTGVYQDGLTGSFILNNNTNSGNDFIGADAIRIYLKAEDQTIIYSSNSKDGQNGERALEADDYKNGAIVEAVTNAQDSKGKFANNANTITLKGNTDTRVEMIVWIEGTDEDCANEMSLENIIAQVQFVKVEKTN